MTSRTTTWTTCFLAAFLVAPLLAHAEDTSKEDDETTVKTVAPKERSVDDARVPSGFVTRVEVDEEGRKGRDLGDALERVPGLSVQRSSSFGRPAFATVRGGNARQLAVSLNGMRISAPAGIGFDVGSLSLAGIDAVDVFRGSAGTVHGGGALSGALDLHASLPERGRGFRGSASVMGGSYETFGAAAHTMNLEESYALRLDVTWRQSEGDFDFVDTQGTPHTRLNNDHRRLGVLAAGRVEVGEHHFEPLLMFEDGSGGAPGPSEFQGQFAEARLDQQRVIGQLGWRRRNLAAGKWGAIDARGMFGYQRRGVDYENPSSILGGAAVSDTSNLHTVELDAEASTYFAFGDILHVMVEGRHEAYSAAHRASLGHIVGATTTDASRQTIAAGLSNELLLAGESVSLVAGLRLEHIGEEPGEAPSEETRGRSWTPLIPSAGLIWRAHKWVELKGNVARTFRAPDFDELYLDMVGLTGNADLAPERAVSADAGVRLGPEDGPVSIEAIYFRNAIEESIYFVAQNAYEFRAMNLGSGVSHGVETMVSVRPGERVDVLGTYTLTEARLDGMAPDTLMPGQPVHQVSVRGEAELAGLGIFEGMPSLQVFGEAGWRSRIYLDQFGNLSNPPFWTVDLGAAFAPVDWVEVGLNARNLADNRQGADSLQRPLPGRAFYGSVKVEFGE